MITYQLLYDLLRKEKYSEELQKLPENFFEEVAAYIKEKREITQREGFEEVVVATKKQLENFLSMLKELLTRRQKKLLLLAAIAAETGIMKRDFESMLKEEEELFKKLTAALEEHKKVLVAAMEGSKQTSDKMLLRFVEDVPAFVGSEGQLGPYKAGQIANLPKRIAEILIEDRKAEAVSVNL